MNKLVKTPCMALKKIGCGLSEAEQAHMCITVVENIY